MKSGFLVVFQREIDNTQKAQVEAQVDAQVEVSVMRACQKTPLSSGDIVIALGHRQLSGNLRKALVKLRKEGFIEFTVKDKPRSKNQKYRLTEKGKKHLSGSGEEKPREVSA